MNKKQLERRDNKLIVSGKSDIRHSKYDSEQIESTGLFGFIFVDRDYKNLIRMIRMSSLSEKEWDIYDYLKEGYSYKNISRKLNISFTTVKSRIYRIYSKLQIDSHAQIIGKDKIIRINK